MEELQPTIICLVETYLDEGDKVEIDGYKVERLDRNREGGGILIAVKENISGSMLTVEEERKIGEYLWVVIDNHRIKIRIGIVYAPQETKTKKKDLERMYKRIERQILIAEEEGQKLILVGDFNAKVGEIISGNKEEVSTAGKILKEMVERTNSKIINSLDLAKGKWTRVEGNKKSILDYLIMSNEDISNINKIEIDEEKRWGMYRGDKNHKVTYSDHNCILAEMNWYEAMKRSNRDDKGRIVLSKQRLNKFKQMTENGNLTADCKNEENIQEMYKTWENKVIKQIDLCFKVKAKARLEKGKKNNKRVRILSKVRRNIAKKLVSEGEESKENTWKLRNELLKEHIERNKKKSFKKKIEKTTMEIKKQGKFNNNAFWKLKEKLTRKEREKRTAMRNKEGEMCENREEIMEIFANFYEELLATAEPRNKRERLVEEEIETMFRQLEGIGKEVQHREIEIEEVKRAVKGLKKKKTGDKTGLRNEMIQWAGKDFIESIKVIFNRVMSSKEVPTSWKNMKIKSIYKKKGERTSMKNRRGIFLTNIISKLFEKVIALRNEKIVQNKISQFQCGGIKNRGTVDHLFTLRAVIDYYRYMKKHLYIFFGDMEKCFDKLWLKDCVIDLWRTGMPIDEVYMIYLLNKESNAVVDTPFGITREIVLTETVRQGTIYGPILCSIATDKINKIGGQSFESMGTNIEIKTLTYVDDICGIGSRENIKQVIENCRMMEENKKMTFNTDKSQYLIMTFGSKKGLRNIEEKVMKGKIGQTNEYKYLGDIFDERGSNMTNIKKRGEKLQYMIQTMVQYSSMIIQGKDSVETGLLIMEAIIMPTILANSETWTNLTKGEIDELEKMQKKVLRKLLGMPKTAPYWGMLAETGSWPMENRIEYKKLMLYQHLLKAEDKRLAKIVLRKQMINHQGRCWYSEIVEIMDKHNIENISTEVERTKKSKWKKIIKDKIQRSVGEVFKQEVEIKTKLRFLRDKTVEKREYIKTCTREETTDIMRIRLNMIETKCNFKNGVKEEDLMCPMCRDFQDTTEHVGQCIEGNKIVVGEKNGKISSEDVTELKKIRKQYKQIMEYRKGYKQ